MQKTLSRTVGVWLFIPLFSLVILLGLSCHKNPVQAAIPAEEPIRFGFFDHGGNRLLSLGPTDAVFDLTDPQVVFATNQRRSAVYDSLQQKSPGSSNRHTAGNFDRLAGHRLTVNGAGPTNQSALLVSAAFFTDRHLPELAEINSETHTADRQRIELLRQRPLQQTWPLLQTKTGAKLQLVLFQPIGDQELASLALILPDRIIWRDFPANYNPTSTWRVDDGGRIEPNQFRILYLGQKQQQWELAYEFIGAEGILLEFIHEEQSGFESVSRASRFTAPL
jgi:hypothetical protein